MNTRVEKILAMVIVFFAATLAIDLARAAGDNPNIAGGSEDEAAIKQVVAGFSGGWNSHDAHAMCSSLADDVQWVSWRGDVSHSRKQVEDDHAELFSGLYKNSHRNDNVKAIRFLTPELASVDNYWSMTGAKKRDGSDWPYRAGYVNFLMAKRDGRSLFPIPPISTRKRPRQHTRTRTGWTQWPERGSASLRGVGSRGFIYS